MHPQALQHAGQGESVEEQNKNGQSSHFQFQKRKGRIENSESIKVFEGYEYKKKEVELTNMLFQYIDENYVQRNYSRTKTEYEQMRSNISTYKAEIFELILKIRNIDSERSQEICNFYKLLDYLEQAFDQLPKQLKSVGNLIDLKIWNQYLAQNEFHIPSNIVDIIFENPYCNAQVFALMVLHLYSMSNEQVLMEILHLLESFYSNQGISHHKKNLLSIFRKYIEFISKKFQAQMDQDQQTQRTISEDLANYKKQLKQFLQFLKDTFSHPDRVQS